MLKFIKQVAEVNDMSEEGCMVRLVVIVIFIVGFIIFY